MADESRKSAVETTVADTLPMAFRTGRVVEVDGNTYLDTGREWIQLPSGGGSGLTQQQTEGLI